MNPLHQVIESSRKAPRTKKLYHGRVDAFMTFAGHHPSEWTTLAVESWRDYLLRDRGLRPQTVTVYINALRYVSKRYARLYDGVDFAGAAETPAAVLGGPPTDSNKSNALTHEELQALIQTCEDRRSAPDKRDYALMMVALHAAFRREELATLHIEHVTGSGDGSMELAVVVKGRRWHKVEIGGESAEALRSWLEWLRRHGVETGPVFRRLRISVDLGGWRLGNGLSGNGVYRILGRRANAAGVKGFHPHRFRHTFITMAREAGWQDWQIAKVTGHRGTFGDASNAMVDRYTHQRSGPLGANFPRLG